MKTKLIDFNLPKKPDSPVIFSFPHSGTFYNETIRDDSKLSYKALRKSEDSYVCDIFSDLLDKRTYFIKANFPRCYVDVNRDKREIDRKLFKDITSDFKILDTPLNKSGYGVIPRKVTHEFNIYNSKISISEYYKRINEVYDNWHDITNQLIADCVSNFGLSIIIDCHSMPSIIEKNINYKLNDFVIGDLNGKSLDFQLQNKFERILNLQKYSYIFNKPFSGNYILSNHTNIEENKYGVQFEIRKDLYMNENEIILKNKKFKELSKTVYWIFDTYKKYLNLNNKILNAAE
tara:strand:+ start:28 stop:897 length:870 start_codon:yes stop_codon:yes gene_type:complete